MTASSIPDSTWVTMPIWKVAVDRPGQVLQLEFRRGSSARGQYVDSGGLLT
jgi:hypothetical protein